MLYIRNFLARHSLQNDANSYRNVYDKTIKITVGREGAERTFEVYRGLVCHYSKYFNHMLNGNFTEGSSETFRLEGIEVNFFQHFYDWMNSAAFYLTNESCIRYT
jgi:hypothetical protein